MDLGGLLKRMLWSMKMTAVLVVVGTFGMVPKYLEKRIRLLEIRERTEIIQIRVRH